MGRFSLIDYLKKYTEIEPFTIDLAFARLYYLKDTLIKNYYSLKKINTADTFFNKSGNGDISIYPPNVISYFDYDYYFQNRLLPFEKQSFDFVPPADSKPDDTLTVCLYTRSPQNSSHYNEIPVYTRFVENKKQQIPIFTLFMGKFDLIIKGPENNIIINRQIVFQ